MFKKIKKRNILILFLILFIFIGIKYVFAAGVGDVTDWVASDTDDNNCGIACSYIYTFLGVIIQGIAWFIGQVSTAITYILFKVATYNEFINTAPVQLGWPIVRDLCNMFFVLILLVIAFATILRIESYNYKRLLPRLIIMAVLINFSKTICGLLIDFSQVIMLTFTNSFAASGAGNLYEAFGLGKIFELRDVLDNVNGTANISALSLLGSLLLGLIVLIIACIVVFIFTIILIFRIVMFWILIILSPIAFLASAFPGGAKYASQWWSEFTKYLIVGPLIAFFLWLAISTGTAIKIVQVQDNFTGDVNTGVGATLTEIGSSDNLSRFLVTVALLMGGLMMASQLGVAGGSMAGSAVARIKSTGVKTAMLPVRGTRGGLDWINRKQARLTGFDFNLPRKFAIIKAGLDRQKKKDLDYMNMAANRNLNLGGIRGAAFGMDAPGWVDQHVRGFLGWKGIESAFRGRKKNIERMRQDAKLNRWKADHVFKDGTDFKNKRIEYEEQHAYAQRDQNEPKIKEMQENLDMLDKYRNELIGGKRELYEERAKKTDATIGRIRVDNYEGAKAFRNMMNEESKNITSTNEDELVAMFQGAQAKNNAPLAAAIALAVSRIGGGNALLEKYGYNAKGGFSKAEQDKLLSTSNKTAEEIQKDKEYYKNNKGINDFTRDVLIRKMGMDEQSAFRLQNDMGSIGEQINHGYLKKAINVDEEGNLIQVASHQRENTIVVEDLKKDPEKGIRNNNRLDYGAENRKKGSRFEWSDSGLAKIIANIDQVNREINNNRFNKSAAQAFAENHASGVLADRLKKLNIKIKEGDKEIEVDEWIQKLKRYSERASTQRIDELVSSRKIV